ncbi:MAG TPA: hypothetical protein PL045_06850 [Chitinophagaceae bacterium]|nr:hypothetical protein [Chitinophagaceae bacterium]
MNIFTFTGAAWKVYKEIKIQKRFNKEFLLPYMNELETKYNGKFSPEQRKKITDYYGLFITSFLCSSYKTLYGKTLTIEERKRATLFGILTPAGDDLMDVDKLSTKEIIQLTFHPEQFKATTFAAHVAKEIQTFLLQHVPHKEAYILASKKVVEIQAETIKQTSREISAEELERITYTKGAVSVIIYHQCLDEVADAQMLEVLFLVGSLFQLGNDIFDLYKDVRDNIHTLINTCNDYTVFRKKFLERVQLQNRKIMALPYSKKNKEAFCITMNAINARSMVALDQFVQFQQQKGEPVDWWQLERKDMIVDMEKFSNILKWLKYIWKLKPPASKGE